MDDHSDSSEASDRGPLVGLYNHANLNNHGVGAGDHGLNDLTDTMDNNIMDSRADGTLTPGDDSEKGEDDSKMSEKSSDMLLNMKHDNSRQENGSSKDSLGVKLKRKSKRGRSSGSLTMKGDKITSFTTERGITYSPNDHVYVENNRPNNPYFICSIQDFSVVKRDTLVVRVKWYYRVTEVPDSVYQHLVQDRFTQKIESDHPLTKPAVKSRELFCSEATDTYPVTALRGKCRVVQCNSLEAARTFQPAADTFYCILGYNPETKRLATTQGQIRVGSMYQARMPECKPNVSPKDMRDSHDLEEFQWYPKGIVDSDLMMYLRAARSVAAFAGMCQQGGTNADGYQTAAMDDTTISAMNMLHKNEYDTGKALQALVKAPALRTIDKKWTEEDTKRFVKGVRVYGKNFFKIRKELLPQKETGELVEYYYFWKKTPAAAANRPHRRHRRHGVKRATTRSQRPASSEFLDLSSASDSDSEDSDSSTGYRCQNCLISVSKDWSNAGCKPNQRLCTKCRIFFKKYGVDRPVNSPAGDSPYSYPLRDGEINGTHNMLTRQNRNSSDSKENGSSKKKGVNSGDSAGLDSPCSEGKKSLVPSSPSALSTSSNCSTDREKKNRKSTSPNNKDKKRHHPASDTDDTFNKRKRSGPSDSESLSDSSISCAEETQNEADEGNQDDLTSSSPPTSPSPVNSDKEKAAPVPIPVESAISGEKLAELPRPEPQHPSPSALRQPIVSSPLPPPPKLSSPLGGALTSPPASVATSHIPQGFVRSLPPLPAFVFRPQFSAPPPGPVSEVKNSWPPLGESIPRSPRASESEDSVIKSSASVEKQLVPSSASSRADSRDTTVISMSKIKEEVVSPVHSPKITIKQEPVESLNFMSKSEPSSNVSSVKSSMDSYSAAVKDTMSPLVTPKIEPGLHSHHLAHSYPTLPPHSFAPHMSTHSLSHSQGQPADLTLTTSDVRSDMKGHLGSSEVKGHLGSSLGALGMPGNFPPGLVGSNSGQRSPVRSRSPIRPRSPVRVGVECESQMKVRAEDNKPDVEMIAGESEEDEGRGTPSPGPDPTPCHTEVHRTNSAIFIKILDRGERNSCCRCDLVFKPTAEQRRKREEQRDRKPSTSSTSTPAKDDLKRKAESPRPSSTSSNHHISTGGGGGSVGSGGGMSTPHHSHADRVTPRSYPDTPALRQLSEYAKPHALGQDVRGMPGYPGYLPSFIDPIRMAMYPHNSRERLEMELERDKRERDARERELREHELRSLEMREKLKAEMEMKPPVFDRLMPGPPGSNPLDPHWLEMQRRYGAHMLAAAGGAGSHHLPGIYPPTSLASDLMARERDRLERLGIPPGHPMLGESAYTALIMERLSAERMSAERHNAERLSAERQQAERLALQDPMIRLQMSGMHGPSAAAAAAAAAAQHAHTHSHTHSHTHLHLHQPDGPLPPPGGPLGPHGIPTSSSGPALPHPLMPPHLLPSFPPGADPMAGVNGGPSTATPPVSLPGLPPHLLAAASRDQELLHSDLYRRAYTDPAIAQQLQHEVFQRMAMDRERFGSGHLPPPH